MRMARLVSLFVLVLSLVLVPAAAAQTLGAVLTGSQEVPPNANPGFGNATVVFDATRQNATVTITVANLGAAINNFHIHEAPAGSNGPVVVNLIGLGGQFVNGTMTGTFAIAPDVAARMLANPSNFYVNVHTTVLPGGAIRGQLAYVSGGAVTYAAELRPSNEVPPTNSTAYGSAFVTFDPINNYIAWDVRANGIASPTLSHIHRGPAGSNGPVIINFATSAAQIPGGRTAGAGPITQFQSANLQPADLVNLATGAGAIGYYVNVHSTAFPGGEVRGQLMPANEYDIAVAGRVTNGLGQTFVTDARVFNPSYTNSVTALIEFLPAKIGANATAANSIAVNIPPRGTAVLDDVAGTASLNQSGSTGALRVTSASPLAVTSRVYLDKGAAGTVGQFVPAQPRSAALRRGVLPQLTNHADLTSGARTNLGFFNPNLSDVTLRLELRDAAGLLVGQQTLIVGAQSQQQNAISSYFPGVDLANAANLTLSFDASAPMFVYAAVNDNVSGDSVLVPAQPDTGVAANQ
ncbi:MAG TPA: CHRD domain-containing protein [Thermoanaerobaculia bacterium]|nr:CHRD domain-containing protein [Thermoanaerobaculia bacterium]